MNLGSIFRNELNYHSGSAGKKIKVSQWTIIVRTISRAGAHYIISKGGEGERVIRARCLQISPQLTVRSNKFKFLPYYNTANCHGSQHLVVHLR